MSESFTEKSGEFIIAKSGEFIIAIMFAAVILFVGVIVGCYFTEEKYQKEAITNNFAHYEVDIDKNITFHWNTNR